MGRHNGTNLLVPLKASDLDPYMTTNVNQQKEIVDKHNSLRRAVQPPASNMVRMVRYINQNGKELY